jgi:hypothetical protein
LFPKGYIFIQNKKIHVQAGLLAQMFIQKTYLSATTKISVEGLKSGLP